ncbi:MAG: anaerobic sulfatase maturase [Eubacteriales bacterium]|nr:anaerobic sulfatase maturase [Eubacteriales bacterium]
MAQSISLLLKPSSSLCNLSCDYCFYCDEAQKRTRASYGFMTEATLQTIIKKVLWDAKGPVHFAYQGGEPTLQGLDFFEKAVRFQKQYNRNQVPVTNALQTNGYLLDADWCHFLKQNDFLTGISLDGTAQIHNKYRHFQGGPTYEKILASAELMQEYQVDFNVLTVVTQDVALHIKEIYEDYQKRGFFYQQYIPCLKPLGEFSTRYPWSLKPETYGRFLIELFDLWYADLLDGKQPYIRQFENYVALAAGYLPESCEYRGICGLQYVVEADGSVYPCDFYMLDSDCLGNFHQDSLETFDKKRAGLRFIERSRHWNADCLSCSYRFLCRNGCQRNRNPENQKNDLCTGYQMFFEACQERIFQLAAAIAGGR